jgi:hypothetical protein
MPRIRVPEDFEGDHILVAGRKDYHYPEADVQVDADHARTLQIRADDDGRYCGPPEQHADAVRAFLGVDDAETCDVVKSDGEVCGRELPCPYHSEGEE